MSKTNRERLLKVPEVAERLHVSEKTAWRLLRDGSLPRVKVSHSTRVPVDAVDRYIASRTAQARA